MDSQKDNLDGLINFKAILFKAPQEFKESLKLGLKHYENDPHPESAAAKRLAEGGEVSAPYIRRGLKWWNEAAPNATPEERLMYGGESGKDWFVNVSQKLDQRDGEEAVRKAAGEMQYKSLKGGIRDVDTGGRVIVGHFSKFGNVDSANEIVVPGAYKRSIKEWGPQGSDRIKTLLQHDPTLLLGKPLVLKEDDFGLYHESLISKTSYGTDILELIKDEVITEQSVGYNVLDYKADKETGTVRLTQLKLFEGSFVTWGANEFTPIHGIKSMQDPNDIYRTIHDMVARMEKALRNNYWNTDEVPTMLELTTKKLNSMLDQLGTLTDLDDSLESSEPVLAVRTASKAEPVSEPKKDDDVTPAPGVTDDILQGFKFDVSDLETKADTLTEKDLKDLFKGF